MGADKEPEAGADVNEGDGTEVPLAVADIEPEAGADENEGDGIEVPLVVAALLERVTEPSVALGMLTLVPPVESVGLLVVLLVLVGKLQPNVDEFPDEGLRSKALMVISLSNGVKLLC